MEIMANLMGEHLGGRVGCDVYLMTHLPQVRPIAMEIKASIASQVDLEVLVLGGIDGLVRAAARFLPESEAEIAIRRAVFDSAHGAESLSEEIEDPEKFLNPQFSAKLLTDAEGVLEDQYRSLVEQRAGLLEKKYADGLSKQEESILGLVEDELGREEFRRADRQELDCGENRFTRVESALNRGEMALDGLTINRTD